MAINKEESQPLSQFLWKVLYFICFAYVLAVAFIGHVEISKTTGFLGQIAFTFGLIYSVFSSWHMLFIPFKKKD